MGSGLEIAGDPFLGAKGVSVCRHEKRAPIGARLNVLRSKGVSVCRHKKTGTDWCSVQRSAFERRVRMQTQKNGHRSGPRRTLWIL